MPLPAAISSKDADATDPSLSGAFMESRQLDGAYGGQYSIFHVISVQKESVL